MHSNDNKSVRKVIVAGCVAGAGEGADKRGSPCQFKRLLCVERKRFRIGTAQDDRQSRILLQLGKQVQLALPNAEHSNIQRIVRIRGKLLLLTRDSEQCVKKYPLQSCKRVAFCFHGVEKFRNV